MIDRSLPLVDLHRHLDGCVRLETILDPGCRHGLPLPAWDVEGLRPHTQGSGRQPGVMEFIAKFRWMTGVMVVLDAARRIAWESVEDARREGLDCVEVRFSPWFMAEPHGLGPAGVAIEANLTSNVQTSTVPDYASHPLRRFLERGLLATINSDDPGISGITLAHD